MPDRIEDLSEWAKVASEGAECLGAVEFDGIKLVIAGEEGISSWSYLLPVYVALSAVATQIFD